MEQKLICVGHSSAGEKYLKSFQENGWKIKMISSGGSSINAVRYCWVLLEK